MSRQAVVCAVCTGLPIRLAARIRRWDLGGSGHLVSPRPASHNLPFQGIPVKSTEKFPSFFRHRPMVSHGVVATPSWVAFDPHGVPHLLSPPTQGRQYPKPGDSPILRLALGFGVSGLTSQNSEVGMPHGWICILNPVYAPRLLPSMLCSWWAAMPLLSAIQCHVRIDHAATDNFLLTT